MTTDPTAEATSGPTSTPGGTPTSDALATSLQARLPELLDQLGSSPDDRRAILDWAPRVLADDAALATIHTLAGRLRAGIGDWYGAFDRQVFDGVEAVDRYGRGVVPLFALLATADDVHAAHRARGVPDDISWATLGDLAQQMRVSRRVHHEPGLGTFWWMADAWSDGFAQLGRLQFELTMSHGDPVLGVHIPATGPMTPQACQASFDAAPAHFAQHYPEASTPVAFECVSWLLDPQLAQIVPGSNMAWFQQLWTLHENHASDYDGLFFGFGVEPPSRDEPLSDAFLDTLPTDTRLHRGLVDLWRAGGHTRSVRGRIPIG